MKRILIAAALSSCLATSALANSTSETSQATIPAGNANWLIGTFDVGKVEKDVTLVPFSDKYTYTVSGKPTKAQVKLKRKDTGIGQRVYFSKKRLCMLEKVTLIDSEPYEINGTGQKIELPTFDVRATSFPCRYNANKGTVYINTDLNTIDLS